MTCPTEPQNNDVDRTAQKHMAMEHLMDEPVSERSLSAGCRICGNVSLSRGGQVLHTPECRSDCSLIHVGRQFRHMSTINHCGREASPPPLHLTLEMSGYLSVSSHPGVVTSGYQGQCPHRDGGKCSLEYQLEFSWARGLFTPRFYAAVLSFNPGWAAKEVFPQLNVHCHV